MKGMLWLVVGSLQAAQATPNPGNAFTAIAGELAGYLTGFLTLMLVIIGYSYASAIDDPQKATAARRAIGMVIVGGILVATAFTFGPTLAGLFKK